MYFQGLTLQIISFFFFFFFAMNPNKLVREYFLNNMV